jgi:hypothetical protein
MTRPMLIYGLFTLGVGLSYLFYLPQDYWWTLRFLFPAFPVLCLLAAVAVLLLPDHPRLLRPAAVVLMAALSIASARERDAFNTTNELRYSNIGRYIAEHLPAKTAVLSMIHSGSANFYSGRLTLRWDRLQPEQLDPLIEQLRQLGYTPVILLDDGEEPQFSTYFKGASRLAALDWAPIVALPRVRLFDATPPARIE